MLSAGILRSCPRRHLCAKRWWTYRLRHNRHAKRWSIELRRRWWRYLADADCYFTRRNAFNSGVRAYEAVKLRTRWPGVLESNPLKILALAAGLSAFQSLLEKERKELDDHCNRLNRERLLLLGELEAVSAEWVTV